MPLLNPVYGLAVPFLCVFTIPLAIFAGITTTLAFSVLMFRVAVVYLDIALTLIPPYLTGRRSGAYGYGYRALPGIDQYQYQQYAYAYGDDQSSKSAPVSPTGSHNGRSPSPTLTLALSAGTTGGFIPSSSGGHRSPRRRSASVVGVIPIGASNIGSSSSSNLFNLVGGGGGGSGRRSRRSSQVSMASVGTIMPIPEAEGSTPTAAGAGGTSASSAIPGSGMLASIGLDRDFEGVGGWRLDRGSDDDWMKINSRLELPHERIMPGARHHQQSQSGNGSGPSSGGVGGGCSGCGQGTTSGEQGGFLTMKTTSPKWERSAVEDAELGSGGKLSISPNSSRVRINQNAAARAALGSMDRDDGYFSLPPTKGTKKNGE